MTLFQSLVEVRTITCDRPRSEFDETKIEEAAQLIIAAEGIINPLILTRTGINSFDVLAGHFEYHAAARAKEIDLAIGETIAAYIIDEESKVISQQVNIFRNHAFPVDKTVTSPPSDRSSNIINNSLEVRLNNLESRLENRFNEIKQEYKQKNLELEQKIISINEKLPEKIEPLTTFNQANLPELVLKLKLVVKTDSKASSFAQQIHNNRPFNSLSEVISKTTGLGDKTMLSIVDRWLNYQ